MSTHTEFDIYIFANFEILLVLSQNEFIPKNIEIKKISSRSFLSIALIVVEIEERFRLSIHKLSFFISSYYRLYFVHT